MSYPNKFKSNKSRKRAMRKRGGNGHVYAAHVAGNNAETTLTGKIAKAIQAMTGVKK